MTAEYPLMTHCPYGHRLGPGRVLNGWHPCECPPAWERHNGHTTVTCLECRRAGRTTRSYQPEHIRTIAEIEQDLVLLRDTLTRAEIALQATPDGPARGQVSALHRRIAALEAIAAVRRRPE